MNTAADLEGENLLNQLSSLQSKSVEGNRRGAVSTAGPGFWKALALRVTKFVQLIPSDWFCCVPSLKGSTVQ